MQKIRGQFAPAFLLDEAPRLKNKIGKQMGQVNRQQDPEEDCH
jgi:hypothetical protein